MLKSREIRYPFPNFYFKTTGFDFVYFYLTLSVVYTVYIYDYAIQL